MSLRLFLILAFMLPSVPSRAAAQRIVSTSVGTDEILFEILSRRQELHRLVAISTLAENKNYSHLEKVPASLKGRAGDSLEALVAYKPDLAIITNYNRQELQQQLKKAGVHVVLQENFRSLADIQSNILLIGRVTETSREAEALVQEMRQSLARLQAYSPCPKGNPTFLQYSGDDTVPGDHTIIHDAATQAGFINLASRLKLSGWTPLSQEVLATLDPDFVVAAGDPGQKGKIQSRLMQIPAWRNLSAVREGRLIVIPERELSSVSHHVTKLVRTLAAARRCVDAKH